jgi:hypothetical protein
VRDTQKLDLLLPAFEYAPVPSVSVAHRNSVAPRI